MGGLSTALALSLRGFKHITVFESAPELAEVGAGINITPNLARLLDHFGVLDFLKEDAVQLTSANIYKAKTDEVLSTVSYKYAAGEFGYPPMVAHRSTLQNALIHGCQNSSSIRFRLGTTITGVDLDKTRIRIRPTQDKENEGDWIHGDIIVAADGVKSPTRALMLARLNIRDEVEDTGQAAYRIMLRRSQLLDKPDLLSLIDSSETHRWIGPKRLIMSYPILSHQVYNISTAHPDENFALAPSASWTTRGSKSRMLQVFSDFCPRVRELLSLVQEDEVCEWKLRVHQPLPTWVDGQTALLGDACHPTLPHIAQGAAQAVEDAAVIAVVLSKIHSKEEINKALRVYQKLRKERAEYCVIQAAENGRELHLSDEEAGERDRRFREANKEGGANPDRVVDKTLQNILFGFDCQKDALERWNELWNDSDL